jgi:hypothetical protein
MDRISLGVMVAEITGRLLTSGCSHTRGAWSTWADILGTHYESYKNVATGGSDNATAARAVIKHAKENDTVVILWTSYDRWSFYLEETIDTPGVKNTRWRHDGSLHLDKIFFTEYYHPVERFQTMIDYILLIDSHSKVNNYQAYHFSAFPLFSGENYAMPELREEADPRLVNIYSRVKDKISNNYLEDISSEDFRTKNFDIITKHTYSDNDTHPTPLSHWEYLEKVIAPKLNVTLDQTKKDKIMQEHENLIKHGITIR